MTPSGIGAGHRRGRGRITEFLGAGSDQWCGIGQW
jgi:hypothetical protein